MVVTFQAFMTCIILFTLTHYFSNYKISYIRYPGSLNLITSIQIAFSLILCFLYFSGATFYDCGNAISYVTIAYLDDDEIESNLVIKCLSFFFFFLSEVGAGTGFYVF